MITVGYWCDECRVKYVRHKCKRRLPCGHDFERAVYVECQAFRKSGEHVRLEYFRGGNRRALVVLNVWIFKGDRRRWQFIGDSYDAWGMRVTPFDPTRGEWEMYVGEWLSSKPEAVIRAYFSRWDSREWVPDWLAFLSHPLAVRARALTVVEKGRS